MDAITTDFWEVLLWSFWFFIWVAAIMVWFRCLWDLFGDSSLSGWGKAGWAILLVFVPWLGALIYLIARGRSMTERQIAAAAAAAGAAEGVHPAGGRSPRRARLRRSPSAKALLDSGTITQEEFDALKAKALA